MDQFLEKYVKTNEKFNALLDNKNCIINKHGNLIKQLNQIVDTDGNLQPEYVGDKHPKNCINKCHSTNIITDIPPEGILINAPGTYCFGNDISWVPLTPISAAIIILSDNVTLNLNNFTLECLITPSETVGIYAIGCTNLKIINGTIKNMGLNGIQCILSKNVLIKKITVDGLTVDNIAVFLAPAGIYSVLSENVKVSKSTVKNIHVRAASAAAIQFTLVNISKAHKCHVTDNVNLDGAATGIGHLLCLDAKICHCAFNNLQSFFNGNLNTQGHTAIAIIPVFTVGIVVKHCSATNIKGTCDDCHFTSIFLCIDAVVKKCKCDGVFGGFSSATSAKATGIEIYAINVKVVDCHVKNISGINPEDKQVAGFSCGLSDNVQFIRCTADNVNVYDLDHNQSLEIGLGIGFGWAPDPRPALRQPSFNILYENCVVRNSQVGFDTWFHINSRWTDVASYCNGIAVLNLIGSQRTISCTPCSECDPPLVVTITNVASDNHIGRVRATYC